MISREYPAFLAIMSLGVESAALRSGEAVSVFEVSLRDGLQNESAIVPTEEKARLLDALIVAGLSRIEITSFVAPKWVPQVADAEDLANLVKDRIRGATGPELTALCPNEKGFERALNTPLRSLGVFISASETHNRRNVNKTREETLRAFAAFVPRAVKSGFRVRGYISTLWGCPYEGKIDVGSGLALARSLVEMGVDELSLGDTIGVGTPNETRDIVKKFAAEFGIAKLALHMHDTRGTALANVLTGLDLGVRTFDASVGGLGGCPYAPGAAGNVATEDLVYMLNGMGMQTGIDLDKLWEAGRVAAAVVGRELPGKVHKAGVRSLRT